MDSPIFGSVFAVVGLAGGAAVSAVLTLNPNLARPLFYGALAVCGVCFVTGLALAVPKLLPSSMRPNAWQAAGYAAALFIVGATATWQASAMRLPLQHEKPAMIQLMTPPKSVAELHTPKTHTSSAHQAVPTPAQTHSGETVGLDVEGNHQGAGNAAYEVQSNGQPDSPSVGGEVTVYAQPGQSAVGMRVTQNGPGIGMRVVQSGPGIGFKSTVIVGKPPEKPQS